MLWKTVRATAVLLATGAAIGGLASSAGEAQAGARVYRGHRAHPGYVVAESRWGNGTISAPVRRGHRGWQVRLPRGTWIDCGRSCSETLRRETIDFWQSNGPQAPDSGVGYLRWDFWF